MTNEDVTPGIRAFPYYPPSLAGLFSYSRLAGRSYENYIKMVILLTGEPSPVCRGIQHLASELFNLVKDDPKVPREQFPELCHCFPI
jgi:hypothetical protein